MEKLIILSGKARCGKDTALAIIKEYYQDKKCMTVSYAYYLKDYLKRMGLYDDLEKPRTLMQEFGATLKNELGELFLINRTMEDIRVFKEHYDIIVITDARFVQEIEIPKQSFPNVVTIRIERPNFDNGLLVTEKNDITETALDTYHQFDYVIQNDANFKENIWRCLDE